MASLPFQLCHLTPKGTRTPNGKWHRQSASIPKSHDSSYSTLKAALVIMLPACTCVCAWLRSVILFYFFPAERVPTSLTVSLEVASLSQPQSQESCYATVADTVNPSWRSDLIICKGTLESNSYFVRVPYERKSGGGEQGCKGREQASWTPAYTTTKKFDLPLRWKPIALLPNMSWQLDNHIKIVILQETVKSGRDEVLTIRKF